MRKQIIVSAIASTVLAGSLYAGTASSTITAGSDIKGNAHSTATNVAVSASASSTKDANATVNNFITYIPNIGIGKGNLITVDVLNGGVGANALNKLWLTDSNSTYADLNGTGALGVATMTDFTSFVQNSVTYYSQMVFKFDEAVDSNHNLVLVNALDTNATFTSNDKIGLGYRTSAQTFTMKNGLACGDKVELRVINSTDQSASPFDVANSKANATALTLVRGVTIKKGYQAATNGTGELATTSSVTTADDSTAYTQFDCPTFSCTISVAQNDLNFGTVGAASTDACPTCSSTGSATDYTCTGSFVLDYNTDVIASAKTTLSTVNISTDAKDVTAIESVKASIEGGTAVTLSNATGTAYTGTLTSTGDTNQTIVLDYKVGGTIAINPRVFDLGVTINTTKLAVDSISNFLTMKEGGSELGIAYLSANPDYRSIVRVTSNKAATIEAVIVTEDGVTSTRFDTGFKIDAATGGAVVVDGTTLLNKAISDAAFAGTGLRFNATLYVKTTGTVDAVAYQTAGTSGSQRYLPVNGATGGQK